MQYNCRTLSHKNVNNFQSIFLLTWDIIMSVIFKIIIHIKIINSKMLAKFCSEKLQYTKHTLSQCSSI